MAAVVLWASASGILAQPVCSIDIGADQTVCQGQTLTLQGPNGYTNYLWNTGQTTQNISVGTPGDYWCQVSYPSGELVVNGNFSAGNSGFTSQYTYSLFTVQNEGFYTVGPNASWYHTQFQGTGNGNFLIANGGWGAYLNNQLDVWCQTIPCCPGQTYVLSFRGLTLTNEIPATAAWYMDGTLAHWPDFTFPAYNAGWQTFTTTWTAGPNQTSVNACIRITSGDGVGDDFGIDDISISGMVYLRDTLNVSVTPLPTVDLGPDQSLCAGDEIDLDATYAGGTYLWQDGSTGPVLHVDQPGTYSVEVTAQGCTTTEQVTVQYNPTPVVDLGPDQTVCPGDAATFNAFAPGATYLWNSGNTSSTFTTDQPGTYSVEVTVGGCVGRDTVDLSNFTLHNVDLGPDRSFCAGAAIRIGTQVPGATYAWSSGASTDSITISAPGIYWVDAVLNGCAVRDSITVTEIPLPVVNLGPDIQVCPGATVPLDATTAGGSYLWNNGATTPTLDAGPGTWSVNVTLNGCVGTGSISISERTPPVVDLGPDVTLCPGETLALDATQPGATYLWNTGDTGPTLMVDAAATVIVTVTDQYGCSNSDTVAVAYANPGLVDLGPDVSFCTGSSVQIGTHIPGASYEWNTGALTDSISVATPGTYWLDVVLSGCTVRDTIEVGETPLPTVVLPTGLVVCPGNEATLDASTPGATYLWNNGATTPTITVGAGMWTVDVTVNGCTATTAATIGQHPAPVLALGPDVMLCPGESVTVNVSVLPGATYVWNTGETGPSITVNTAGVISVILTDANGCTATDSLEVFIADPGSVSLGPDIEFCNGSNVTLDATTTGAAGYLWNTGADSPTLTTDQPGTYWVEILMGTCTVSDTIILTGIPGPDISLGADTILCPGASLLLHVPAAGLQLQWQDGSQGDSFLVEQAGQYEVEVVDGNGCTAVAAIQVDYLPQDGFDLGPDTTICTGASLVLDAGLPNGTTQWSGASNAPTPSITVTGSGTYIATTSVAGCAFSDTIQVQVVGPPPPDLGPDTTFCAGGSITLSASGGSLLWDDGSTNGTRSITGGGLYWVEVTADGCTASDTITVNEVPLPIVDLGADTSLCGNATLAVDVAVPGGTYLWNDGGTSSSRTLGAGVWQVMVTVSGCSSSDTVVVQSVEMPVIALPSDTTLCLGQTWTINVAQNGASYQWSTGSTAPSITVNGPGTYSVTIDRAGCIASASVAVDVVDLSGFTLGPDTTLCPGNSLVLSIALPGAGVIWQDGSTATQRVISNAGTYSATVNLAGCTAYDEIQVGMVAIPLVDLGGNRELCLGDTLVLPVDPGAAQVLWNTGSTAPELTVTAPGHYSVALHLDGCTTSDDLYVIERPLQTQLNLGPDGELCPGSPLLLDATIPGATSYLWSDGSTGPTLTVTKPGIYSVAVAGYCIDAADVIKLEPGICMPLVYVPNAFTPDGDGRNDTFLPSLFSSVDKWEFRVFNRWGELIFESKDPQAGWDGTRNGKDAPQGVYVWDLRYEGLWTSGAAQEHLRGHVTLLR